jgi:hypothetical protein
MVFPGFIVDQLPSAYPTAGHLSPYVPDLAGPDDSVNYAGYRTRPGQRLCS